MRKEIDRGIMEDGASVAALMCGRWVDRVAELWLWNGSWQSHFSRGDLPGFFQWWENRSEEPFPLVMNIYLVRVFTGCCREWQIMLSKATTYILFNSVSSLLSTCAYLSLYIWSCLNLAVLCLWSIWSFQISIALQKADIIQLHFLIVVVFFSIIQIIHDEDPLE